jgi:2-succinyl-6-hydroxy-2,4-cyclohexadiene-1-carboxylate synthase
MVLVRATCAVPSIRVNRLSFHYEDQGEGDPVVFLHGFTGQSATWTTITKLVSETQQTIAIDLIGHGRTESPRDVSRFAYSQAIDDLAAILAKLELRCATWVGYSMGGRLALGIALRYPEIVSGLILESASPGIAEVQEREARRQADELLADEILSQGVREFVARWEALPMWESQLQMPIEQRTRQREIRVQNRAEGLAGSLRGLGAGVQDSLWEGLGELQAPTLVIAGERDAKFAEIATRMAGQAPNAELVIVPNVGHAVHLEQPEIYAAHVARIVATHAPTVGRA